MFEQLLDSSSMTANLAGFAILGTALGFIIRGWSSIKQFFYNLSGILLIRVNLEDETTSKAVLSYLIQAYKKLEPMEKTIGGKHENFRDGKYGYIPYELVGDKSLMFWNGWIPFWFAVAEEKSDSKETVIHWFEKPKAPKKSSLIYFRYCLDTDKIIQIASRSRNNLYWNCNGEQHKRFFVKKIPDPNLDFVEGRSASTNVEWFHEGIYRLIDHKSTQLGKSFNLKDGELATNNLYFPPHIKKLVEEVKVWHKLKNWYIERGIAWKRGWCLYGPPGTGKSSIVRAIAEDLDMPLFVYALGRMTDKDLEVSWAKMQAHTPCIALFEDFDTVFHGRTNIYGKASLADKIESVNLKSEVVSSSNDDSGLQVGKLSFGCLLNCIDGVDKSNGIFTIITTNNIEHLDSALGQPVKNEQGGMDFISTRPGRIDKAIELGYMATEDKMQLAKRIFYDNQEGLDIISKNIDLGKPETPAQFQERCSQVALELMWNQIKE